MNKLYYIRSNDYDMVFSIDSEGNSRYITDESFGFEITAEEKEDQKKQAEEFLESVEDDSSWKDDCEFEDIMNEYVEILAEIEKYL